MKRDLEVPPCLRWFKQNRDFGVSGFSIGTQLSVIWWNLELRVFGFFPVSG